MVSRQARQHILSFVNFLFLNIVTCSTNGDPGKNLKMTQAELAESVFAKLAVDAEFIPESDETMELGTFLIFSLIFYWF